MKSIPIYQCNNTKIAVTPYFNSVYLAIISVIQSTALAGLLITLNTPGTSPGSVFTWQIIFKNLREPDTIILALRFLVAGALFVLIWFKYVNHHQFIGWQLECKDAIFTFALAVIEYFIIIFMKYGDATTFYSMVGILYLYGIFAYRHAINKTKDKYILKFLRNHYLDSVLCISCHQNNIDNKSNNADMVLLFMQSYFKRSMIYTLKVGLFFLVFTIILSQLEPCFRQKLSYVLIELISALISLTFTLIFLIKYDIKSMMKENYFHIACPLEQEEV